MDLLGILYPSLLNADGQVLPSWEDCEQPWSILDEGEGGLIWQINNCYSEDGIFIHPDAKIGENVLIEGPCYIGSNAEVRHSAYLRKGSWISENAVVGHATEIKNSILLPGSKAPHFNYVGDSIIGFGANLGAGVKLANVRNDKRSIDVRMEDGSRFHTGMNKLGALIGDGSQLGCNVVTNPGSIITPMSMIGPNMTVLGWI